MQKIRKKLAILILFLIPTYPPRYQGRLLDRYAGSVFFPFFFKKITLKVHVVLLILNFVYAYFFQSLTGTLMAILMFVVMLIPSYNLFRLLFGIGLASFVALLIYLTPYFSQYSMHAKGANLFGNLELVYAQNKLLQVDHNSSWRMVYWYRVLVERFPENLLGIGFGTPYLPYQKGKDTADSLYDDEHDAHTTGAHNSYITLFARLGILVFLFFFAVYTIVLKEFYRFKQYYIANHHIVFFMGFFASSVIALFNPFLGTPTYAGTYWFFLGLVAKSIHERRWHNENTSST